MITGTTPTHTFELPFDVSFIKELKIIYHQLGEKILEKSKEDCTVAGNTITTRLTQEETFLFKEKPVTIVVRILTEGGDALASDEMTVNVRSCLDEEVLK